MNCYVYKCVLSPYQYDIANMGFKKKQLNTVDKD